MKFSLLCQSSTFGCCCGKASNYLPSFLLSHYYTSTGFLVFKTNNLVLRNANGIYLFLFYFFHRQQMSALFFYHVMKCNDSLWTFPTKTTENINLLDVHLGNLIFALFLFFVFYCEDFVILLLTGVI